MSEKIPNIDDNDIKRIIKRDFPNFEFNEIEKQLKKYNSQTEKGKNRIYASILKLSNGNIELVKKIAEKANKDYRDIIAQSEYPNYSRYAFGSILSEEEKQKIINDDWEQYETWLNKP